MASDAAVASTLLVSIPDDISINNLPDIKTINERLLHMPINYFTQGCIHKIKIYNSNETIKVTVRCWRSMKKSEKPHEVHIGIQPSSKTVVESYCTSKVGYVN